MTPPMHGHGVPSEPLILAEYQPRLPAQVFPSSAIALAGNFVIMSRPAPLVATARAHTILQRVPVEYISRTIQRHERRLQSRRRLLCNGLRRPAIGAMHDPDGAR